jgi:hypothetical protein
MRRFESPLVLLGYVAASLILLGRFTLLDPQDAVVGRYGADQGFFIWSLVHWLEAVRGDVPFFVTDRIDAPIGFNLAWATTIPGASLLMLPATALIGPIATYNVLALLAPALAAWTGYLLCRHLTGDAAAAIAGGWLFGFSSYLLSQTLNHLNLALIFPIPLIVLLVIRLVDGTVSIRKGTVLLALAITAQFWIFLEIAATATVIGTVALLTALAVGTPTLRQAILAAIPAIAGAYAIALVLVAPLLIGAFAHPNPIGDRIFPELYPLDALNPFVPTTITWLGGEAFADVSRRFAGNLTEQTGYVGLPLLVIAVWSILERRRQIAGRILGTVLVVSFVLALGARLVIMGTPTIPLPWRIAEELPLIDLAIPARIFAYAALATAVAAALWILGGGRPRTRLVVVAAAGVFLLPVQDATFWRTPLERPAGILTGTATADIEDDEVVLVLPYGPRGQGMLWQAGDDLRWRQAGSYSAAALPAAYAGFPIMGDLYRNQPGVDAPRELARFLAFTGTETVLLPTDDTAGWAQVLNDIGLPSRDVDGVRVVDVDPAILLRTIGDDDPTATSG